MIERPRCVLLLAYLLFISVVHSQSETSMGTTNGYLDASAGSTITAISDSPPSDITGSPAISTIDSTDATVTQSSDGIVTDVSVSEATNGNAQYTTIVSQPTVSESDVQSTMHISEPTVTMVSGISVADDGDSSTTLQSITAIESDRSSATVTETSDASVSSVSDVSSQTTIQVAITTGTNPAEPTVTDGDSFSTSESTDAVVIDTSPPVGSSVSSGIDGSTSFDSGSTVTDYSMYSQTNDRSYSSTESSNEIVTSSSEASVSESSTVYISESSEAEVTVGSMSSVSDDSSVESSQSSVPAFTDAGGSTAFQGTAQDVSTTAASSEIVTDVTEVDGSTEAPVTEADETRITVPVTQNPNPTLGDSSSTIESVTSDEPSSDDASSAEPDSATVTENLSQSTDASTATPRGSRQFYELTVSYNQVFTVDLYDENSPKFAELSVVMSEEIRAVVVLMPLLRGFSVFVSIISFRRGSIVGLYNVTVESDVEPPPPSNLDDLIIRTIQDDISTNPNGALATRNALGSSVRITEIDSDGNTVSTSGDKSLTESQTAGIIVGAVTGSLFLVIATFLTLKHCSNKRHKALYEDDSDSQSYNSPVKNYPQRLWTSDGYQNGYYGNQHTNMGWNDYDSSIPQQQAPTQRPVDWAMLRQSAPNNFSPAGSQFNWKPKL